MKSIYGDCDKQILVHIFTASNIGNPNIDSVLQEKKRIKFGFLNEYIWVGFLGLSGINEYCK